METYTVKVYENGYYWYQNGKLIAQYRKSAGGHKEWWIEGKKFTQKQFNKTQKSTCENRTVIIDGVAYKLVKE